MHDTPPHDRRIDPDHREPSPSTGWRETALLLDAPNAHDAEDTTEDDGDDLDGPTPSATPSPVGVAQ